MSEPSNIRINPFVGDGGTTTYINLTETHIIPSVSPYVIRLNEVPEKQEPSNIRAVWVDSSTGAVTASALTEVAATPAAGEFRPDYSTKADGNDNWNTGLIEFSAVDAGKIVQISYTGMGTLAAVQSNKYPSWYTDRGDGSDGDFIPDADCTISGVKNYKRVFIKAGVNVNVTKWVRINCQNEFFNNGTINADGQGAEGGPGRESASDFKTLTDGASGLGGVGGAGGLVVSYRGGCGGAHLVGTVKIEKNGLNFVLTHHLGTEFYGSGGGGGGSNEGRAAAGGAGGGGVLIFASTIYNNGKITARGINGGTTSAPWTGSGGGGGGGLVVMVANTIKEGILLLDGGKGGLGDNDKTYPGADGDDGVKFIKRLGAV